MRILFIAVFSLLPVSFALVHVQAQGKPSSPSESTQAAESTSSSSLSRSIAETLAQLGGGIARVDTIFTRITSRYEKVKVTTASSQLANQYREIARQLEQVQTDYAYLEDSARSYTGGGKNITILRTQFSALVGNMKILLGKQKQFVETMKEQAAASSSMKTKDQETDVKTTL